MNSVSDCGNREPSSNFSRIQCIQLRANTSANGLLLAVGKYEETLGPKDLAGNRSGRRKNSEFKTSLERVGFTQGILLLGLQ